MAKPHISVLIDTYNHERYIEQAILSALEQDFPANDTEIVVVDDGSTDKTPAIIQKFVPRVRHLRLQNGGQAAAYNASFPELQGRIVSFLDGDDWWTKKKLTAVAEAFERNPEIAAVGHGFYEVRDNDPPREMFVPTRTCRLDLSSVEAARFANAGLTLLGTSRLSVRFEVLNRIGPVPIEVVFFDAPVFSLALALGGAVILDQPLCYYRQHSTNLYAPMTMDPVTQRRRFERLGFLLSYVPPRLREFGAASDVVDAFVESPRIEFERSKLQFGEGGRWQVFRTELQRFSTVYEHPNLGYMLFKMIVSACALLLSPQRFYQLLNWYSRNDLKRFRNILGSAQPKAPLTFFQRLPVSDR